MAVLPNYTTQDVIDRVNNYLAASGLTDPTAPAPTVTYTTETLSSGFTVDVATVVVQYPANLNYLGPIAALIGGTQRASILLRAASVMRTETSMGGS